MWKINRPPGVVVSMLSVCNRTDTPVGEIGDDIDQVPQRATQPVQPPHHQRVARPQRLQPPIQLRPPLSYTADVIGERPPAAGRAQRIALEVRVLLQRGYPGIAQQRSHARDGSETRARPSARHTETDTGLRDEPTCGDAAQDR
jgi:hypothetical protein